MSFGPIMRTKTSTGMQIELAPFAREEIVENLRGYQKDSVVRYMSLQHHAQVKESVEEWYDKIAKDTERILWGLWVIEGGKRQHIGNTALMDFEKAPLFQATSGIIIVDSDYWGKGIASAAHKARTWYAFRQLGLVRIKSAVRNGNEGSLKALERSGYGHVYTERNTSFVDGAYRHQYNLECLNPDDWAWRLWWGDDRPTRKAIDARKVTEEVLRWAEKNVDLL